MPRRIAFIDHSFHKKTASSVFFREMLSQVVPVDEFWDEEWRGGEPLDAGEILARDYDRIIVFQAEGVVARIARLSGGKNLVFVPMWDSSGSFGRKFWVRDLAGVQMVCFSRKQAEQLARWGVRVKAARYFPEPQELRHPESAGGLRGFFWWRREELPFRWVQRLCHPAAWQSLHVHLGPDPHNRLDESELKKCRIPVTISRWGEEAGDYLAALQRADVVFASRLQEGIGMSVLEGMAAGKAVVAVDRPTMSEYITPGVTGFLVSHRESRLIDVSRARECGARAWEAVERGHAEWLAGRDELLEWVLGKPQGGRIAIRVPMVPAPREAGIVIGHYEEWVDGRLEERRICHPSAFAEFTVESGGGEALARVPVPEAVFSSGGGKQTGRLSSHGFARVLAEGPVWHLDQTVARVSDLGWLGRRRCARFQARVLAAFGVDHRVVENALKERLVSLADDEFESARTRRRVLLRPWVWPTVVRRMWPMIRFYGLRGGLRLGLAKLRKGLRKS